jgi:hypothetical protein
MRSSADGLSLLGGSNMREAKSGLKRKGRDQISSSPY